MQGAILPLPFNFTFKISPNYMPSPSRSSPPPSRSKNTNPSHCTPVPGTPLTNSSSGKCSFQNPVDIVTPSLSILVSTPELASQLRALLSSGCTSPVALVSSAVVGL